MNTQPIFIRIFLIAWCFSLFLFPSLSQANDYSIRYIVNGEPVTVYDINQRQALTKLFGIPEKNAEEEMILQALKISEIKKMKIIIPKEQVDSTYSFFAKSNNIKLQDFDNLLNKAGVTKSHFKKHIYTQIGWDQVLTKQANALDSSKNKTIYSKKKQKPKIVEYTLQYIIFVIPRKDRAKIEILKKRKKEAEIMRSKFSNCSQTYELAKQFLDVTVKPISNHLEFYLPPQWKEKVEKARKANHSTTSTQTTEDGIEFVALCKVQKISDDRIADMILEKKENKKNGNKSSDYLIELRKKAKIIKR